MFLNKRFLFISALFFSQSGLKAQLVDNSSTFNDMPADHYLRFHYDNDFFTNTDYYYTQGITLEYAHTGLKKFFLSKILITPARNKNKFGISYNLFGYTPTSIKSNTILYGDRPFEGSMSLKLFGVSTNAIKQYRLATAFSLGIIGPAALGKEIQTVIHRWTDNPIPQGWQYQIKNDIILNYQLNVEKKILAGGPLLVNLAGEVRIGTLHDRVGAGINFMAGHFNNPYTGGKKKINYYLYGQAKANLVGYDATMQGGLFNQKSVYTIPSGAIERATGQVDGGIVISWKKLFLSYHQSYLTKEFSTGKTHRWGGISLGFSW